ncbi:MAG TPA: hypothetical protein VFM05_14240 [Candidatus Saccharimonadales bacterium]|nr:hypothetical protein [Candidatus Saccharimonadales bacterium]
MSSDKPRPARHLNRGKPECRSIVRSCLSHKGWYAPEEIKILQQLFDELWFVLRRQVFPWDVEASREQLAILVFRSISGANNDAEQLKQAVLSLEQIQQLDCKRSGSTTTKAMVSKTSLVTPIYDPQHLPAP